jgi:hypothetical protein
MTTLQDFDSDIAETSHTAPKVPKTSQTKKTDPPRSSSPDPSQDNQIPLSETDILHRNCTELQRHARDILQELIEKG